MNAKKATENTNFSSFSAAILEYFFYLSFIITPKFPIKFFKNLLRMLFYSFFKSLVGKEVTVELKNDLGITGMLHSVDQYLNIKLQDIYVTCPGTVK